MLTIFTLASGRSGTTYMAEFFKKNIIDCIATHEPYNKLFNPTLFGKPIYYNTHEMDEDLLKVLERKAATISKYRTNVYFEANHAFLKSAHRHAAAVFKNLGLLHLVRNPLLVAKSELNRENLIHKIRHPMRHYKVGGSKRYFYWALTGEENIYNYFDGLELSRFQFYLIQWIELENRASAFLQDPELGSRSYTLHAPFDFKDPQKLKEMADVFGVTLSPDIDHKLKTNKTPFVPDTVITSEDKDELAIVLDRLPDTYLEIFRGEPYSAYDWSKALAK